MRIKAAVPKILLVVVTLIIGMTCLEVGYRLKKNIPLFGNMSNLPADTTQRSSTFQRSSSSRLLYEPKPGAHSRYTGVDNFISSQGLRDREYSVEKPADTFRIAFVGDSIVYGYGVPVEHSLPKQLEAMLNNNPKKKKFEVMNFGVPGWGTSQELEWYLRKVKPFSPDLVIVGYCLNDTYVASWEYELFVQHHFSLWTKFYSIEAMVDGIRIAWQRRRFADSAPTQRVNDPIFAGVKNIKDTIAAVQPTLLVIFPVITPFDKYKELDIHNRVREAAAHYGIEHFDLFQPLSKHDYKKLRVQRFVGSDHIHLGKFGSKVAAEALLERLTTQYPDIGRCF